MVRDFGVLPGALAQREVAVLAAPDVQLVDYQVCRNMRQQLRRLLGLDYAGLGAVLGKRRKKIVQRVDGLAYALRRLKLHDEQCARQLRAEVERDRYEPVKQLPDALKVVLRVREFPEALLVVLLRLCDNVVQNTALALEHRIENRARNRYLLANLVDADVVVALGLEQLYRAFRNAFFEPV